MDGEVLWWSREWRGGGCDEDLGQKSFLCRVHKCKYDMMAALRVAMYADLRIRRLLG